MKIALPINHDEISTVIDFSTQVVIVTIIHGRVNSKENMIFPVEVPVIQVETLLDHGVDLVICGSMSKQFCRTAELRGLKIISHICGNIEEVIEAYLSDNLAAERFLLPGCPKGKMKRRRRGSHLN